jgi:succinate dehydrogenase / fumarate reductase flavoprotein subunit
LTLIKHPEQEQKLIVDVLVIGSGGAGCSAAHKARQLVGEVVLVTRGEFLDSKTSRAQGGIQAAIGDGDSPSLHYQDTMKAGEYTNDPQLVKILTERATETIQWLERQGIAFDREGQDYRLQIAGGLSKPRILSCGDGSGNRIMARLSEMISGDDIRVEENSAAVSIQRDSGMFRIELRSTVNGDSHFLQARSVVITAGGGIPQEKRQGLVLSGGDSIPDSIELAASVGAEIVDSDLVQYHPTGIILPESLRRKPVPEGVRAAGAKLLNCEMKPFADEMATRRILCDAIVRECQEGRGISTEDGRKGVWLNTPAIDQLHGAGATADRFPVLYREMLEHDHDITQRPILVYPLVHYTLGGIRIDANAETTIDGLYAAGEAAWGVHGSDRLMGNSLLDVFVFGRIAGEQAARHALDSRQAVK